MKTRKTADTYDVAGLKGIQQRLVDHRHKLVMRMRDALKNDAPDFDTSVAVRDAGQLLCTTCLVIQDMPDTIELAELTGAKHAVPYLERCGLDRTAEDD